MDKIISKDERRKKRGMRSLRLGLIPLVLLFLFFSLKRVLAKELDLNELKIAEVEYGEVRSSFTADGYLKPVFELELSSEAGAILKEVYHNSGDVLKKGDPILDLDDQFMKLEVQRSSDELEKASNQKDLSKLTFDKNLKEQEYQTSIELMKLDDLKAQLVDAINLKEIGGTSEGQVESLKLKVNIAELEYKKMLNRFEFNKSANLMEKRKLDLDLNIQRQQLEELRRKQASMSLKAPVDGVLTYVSTDLGRRVEKGALLAKIAKLNSFYIEASCSDRYQKELKVGMRAKVRLNDKFFDAQVSNILPEIGKGSINFLLSIPTSDSLSFMPNARVEVELLRATKSKALRLKKGMGIKSSPVQEIFVMNGDQLEKRILRKGMIGDNYVEIIGGDFEPGDKVIISDMEEYEHLDQIRINESN